MGALQEIFASNSSNDIVCSTGNAWLSYDSWSKEVEATNLGKSGPVTTIAIGKADVDQILNKLGVIQRVGCSVADIVSVDHSLFIRDIRKTPAKVTKAQQKIPKIGLQPKDLMVEDLQELIGEVEYHEIMEMYGFTSERYFKETIKTLGYRILRGELWVVADKLWLEVAQ